MYYILTQNSTYLWMIVPTLRLHHRSSSELELRVQFALLKEALLDSREAPLRRSALRGPCTPSGEKHVAAAPQQLYGPEVDRERMLTFVTFCRMD